jgi:hypothetical protein
VKGDTMKNAILFLAVAVLFGCDVKSDPVSPSGVKKAEVAVSTNAEGLTVEQENIKNRLLEDNKIGSIKHLYVISTYSGQVIIYSTVKGKVTSGGKRISPSTVGVTDGGNVSFANRGIPIEIGGQTRRTGEVLGDDGAYGQSSDYLFWWDTRGIYHQHYVSGGQIIHVSSEPLAVKQIMINLNVSSEGK